MDSTVDFEPYRYSKRIAEQTAVRIITVHANNDIHIDYPTHPAVLSISITVLYVSMQWEFVTGKPYDLGMYANVYSYSYSFRSPQFYCIHS